MAFSAVPGASNSPSNQIVEGEVASQNYRDQGERLTPVRIAGNCYCNDRSEHETWECGVRFSNDLHDIRREQPSMAGSR